MDLSRERLRVDRRTEGAARSTSDGSARPGGASLDVAVLAAEAFVATHGRVLERRRLRLLLTGDSPDGMLAALDAYRNSDGGYGWGLEPDLRSPESQPACAMHAFEVIAEAAPTTSTCAAELCDWLAANSLPDGALPFALATTNPAGCAPFWLEQSAKTSSLQMTTQVAANALRVGWHDSAVRDHPWLARATAWCVEAIRNRSKPPSAYELLFALRFLDAAVDANSEALGLLDRLDSSHSRFPVRLASDAEDPAGSINSAACRPVSPMRWTGVGSSCGGRRCSSG